MLIQSYRFFLKCFRFRWRDIKQMWVSPTNAKTEIQVFIFGIAEARSQDRGSAFFVVLGSRIGGLLTRATQMKACPAIAPTQKIFS
jgi:hypothetical protein